MIFKNLVLDAFQEKAINHIKNGHSVLISAPTGTGKTLIADFVTENHIFRSGRVIYTSPIKALSNQKYREYCDFFGSNNIGLMTGDFKININASFVIMTTEILRNILYSDDNDYIESIVSVIFDEIHYIGDEDRGVAWEESIIKLPSEVQIIGLSATIPNIKELAEWISYIKGKRVYYVRETKRYVPLKYYIFARGHDLTEIRKSEDIKEFISSFYTRLGHGSTSVRKNSQTANHMETVKYLGTGYFPLLYFNFNRKQCEEYARLLAENFDYLSPSEKGAINKEIAVISESYADMYLKEIQDLHSILEKGIGFHHSGMNPVYKRLVEILVEKGLIKVLYCTSTFALGLNFPVKTVVFGSISKFNGVATMPLTSQQFHQKAGRAGRRGIDDVGHVIITSKLRDFNAEILMKYITGYTEKVKSAFDLSFNSIINLLYLNPPETIDSVLLQSFWAFQEKPDIRMQNKELQAKKENLSSLTSFVCTFDSDLHENRIKNDKRRLRSILKQIRDAKRRIRHLENITRDDTDIVSKNMKMLNKKRLHLNNLEKRRDHLINNSEEYICRDCIHYEKCALSKKSILKLRSQINHLNKSIKEKEGYLSNEFWGKVDILKGLGYLTEDLSFESGAYILKEIQINELLLTEIILENVFEKLDHNEINALCASLGSRASKKSAFDYQIELLVPYMDLVSRIADKLVKIGAVDSKNEIEYDFGLSGYAYMWSSGISWSDMMSYLSSYESPISVSGDLVYSFRRGIDILRQVMSAYRNDDKMYSKLKECIGRMDRDIISIVI